MRERLAGLLSRSGALEALMHLRRWAPVHTLPIVTYHHVAEEEPGYPYDPDVADATPAQFRTQMEWLAKHCTPIGVDELVRAIDDDIPLPKNAVMVTFDDGYKSCHDVALPILRTVGVRATFFVATKFVQDRRLYWWERIALVLSTATRDVAELTYPAPMRLDRRDPATRRTLVEVVKNTSGFDVDRFLDDVCRGFGVEWNLDIERKFADALILTWDETRALSRAGMDIESHGRTHRVLQTLDDATLHDELTGSRQDLERELNRPIRAIAYPVGRRIAHVPRIRQALEQAGYRVGLSNMSGVNRLWPAPLKKAFSAPGSALFRKAVSAPGSALLRKAFGIDRWDIARLATDRVMSHAMYTTQMAIPRLAYIHRHNRDGAGDSEGSPRTDDALVKLSLQLVGLEQVLQMASLA